MNTEVVPSSFNTITVYQPSLASLPTTPGQVQGMDIRLPPSILDDISEKIVGWFVGRQEIDIVDVGVSDKQGLGIIMIDWMECEMDPLFLAILGDEEMVGDDTVYGRHLEG